jgi:hypothetical protein
MVSIYVLERNNTPFYVGKTTQIVEKRVKIHKKRFGDSIDYFIVDKVEDWRFWEKYYISLFKSWGFILENKNEGGGGTDVFSEERRKKHGLAQKGTKKPGSGAPGRPKSEEFKSERRKPRLTKEWIEKLNKSRKNVNLLEKNRKISEKLKGRKITWKTRP